MKSSWILLTSGLLTAVYASDPKRSIGWYDTPECSYKCESGPAPPLSCIDVTSKHRDCKDFTFEGCYNDSFKHILLGHLGRIHHDVENTHENCAQSCFRYRYYAVSNEACLCGDNIKPWGINVDVAQCDLKCPGDDTEYCGSRFNAAIYRKKEL